MKSVQLLLLLLALNGAQAPAQTGQSPAPAATIGAAEQEAIMDRIEHGVRLPESAGPLASYARSYALREDARGTRIVAAVYVRGGTPGRRWVRETDLPMIEDGGCGIVSLLYDVPTQR